MRALPVAAALIAGSCAAFQAQAQTTPNVLIAGQVKSALAYGKPGWCAVTQGGTTMQRNLAAPVAVLSFPELTFFDGTTYYLLNGQARLVFGSAADGVIYFKDIGKSISSATFDKFSEVSSGRRYVVRFSILFPNNCTLPISVDLEAP